MANNQFSPPVLAPDLIRRQMDLQRNQMLAQNLMQTEAPQGQMVSGHYVAPHFTQQLAAALRPVVGQQVMNRLPEQMAGLQQAQQDYDRQRFNSVFGGGSQAGADPRREFMIAQLMGLDKYAAEKLRQSAPTNEQKNLGFLPESVRNQAIMAPFVNEMNQDGVQNVLGQNGQVQAFAVPGYSDIQAQKAGAVAGAQAQAQAQNRLVSVPDGKGGTVMMPEDQAIATLRDGPAATGAGPASPGGLGTTPSKSVIDARSELPKLVGQIDQIENTINSIKSHPGLEAGTGLSSYLPSISGQARDFDALAGQLQGQVFLQAYESLKGGGVITDFEGAKAEKALARSQQAQTKEAYVAALNEFLDVVQSAKKRAYEKAGVPMPEAQKAAQSGMPQPGTVDGGWRFNGGDPANPASWSKVGG